MGADSDHVMSDPNRGNTVVRAKSINIDSALDVYTNQSQSKSKQSGLSVSVSNSLVDSVKSIDALVDAAGNTESVRMKGLASTAGLLKTKALAKDLDRAASALQSGNLNGVGNTRIQATIGSQKSQSNSSSYNEVNQGSNITTGNLALIATGAGTGSNININGSNLNVTSDALFQADNDFNVSGVAQNSNTRSTNSSSSAAIGGYASTGSGVGITANSSKGKGYANSNINVGNTTTLDIGNDLNLKGRVLNTNKIQGAIGGDVIQKMLNFVENPYVKSEYEDLRNQTIAKLESNPELVLTYFDSLAYKFNAKDQSILNRYIKPTIQAGGGAIGAVGSVGGAAYACGASAGIGCYAAAIAGSAGLTSSSDHLITGTKNFGKPLSEQDPTQIVQTLKRLGLSTEAAQTLQLGIDVLGTGGVGFGVGSATKAGKFATPSTNAAKNTRPNFIYSDRLKLQEELARQAGIPRGIERKPEVLWGNKVDDIKRSFEMDGATVIRKPQRGKSNAIVYEVKGGASGIKEFEYHPGGGSHTDRGVEYYKIVKTDGTEVRIFDPSKPFKSGTITPKQKYLDPQGNEYIKRNGLWIKK